MKQIVLDSWLSKLIGKPTYFLQSNFDHLTEQDLPKDKIFIWTKISVNDLTKLEHLQKLQNRIYKNLIATHTFFFLQKNYDKI